MHPPLRRSFALVPFLLWTAGSIAIADDAGSGSGGAAADAALHGWKPEKTVLMTRWGKTVTPDGVLPEYPRPQMIRESWSNLNGLWQFEIGKPDDPVPFGKALARQILVPFAMESTLSGIRETAEFVWYRRIVDVPKEWRGKRVLLHFGAVDWESRVYVNGKEVGTHRGGYDPFTIDVTDALDAADAQELIVGVSDPMKGSAAGKQSRALFMKPRSSIFYECVTGIWQTVWMEPVPTDFIDSLKIDPRVDDSTVDIETVPNAHGSGCDVDIRVMAGAREVARSSGKAGERLSLRIPDQQLWSPDSPFLYDLEITLKNGGKPVDAVESYFAMRKISIGSDERGITRILLNNAFTFMLGSLDQGFWPDGIYTAPTDEALRFDIEFAKRIGLNLARKHVKVEPERWYSWCDKLGLLVWQDMPCFSPGVGYEEEFPRIIAALRNHPSIVAWIMMNEGYPSREQQETVTAIARRCDRTRLVTANSGWRDMGFGDLNDRHDYPGPSSPIPTSTRAAVLSEWGKTDMGGITGHDWFEIILHKKCQTLSGDMIEKLDRRHEIMMRKLWGLVYTPGLSGAAWTQLTDIENETNGFITYDREIIKNTVERITAANQGFVEPTFLPSVTKTDEIYEFTDSVEVGIVSPRADTDIRFTVDGSEPTKQSRRYSARFPLTDTTTVKAVAFWPDRSPSRTVTCLFEKESEFDPAVSPENPRSGIAWAYLEDGKVVQSGTSDRFTFRPDDPYVANPKEKSRFEWKGYLNVPRDGVYTIQRPAENLALSIGSRTLFTTLGGLGDKEETAQVSLKAGYHLLEAHWLQSRNGYYTLDCPVLIEGPGIAKQAIPPAWLASDPSR